MVDLPKVVILGCGYTGIRVARLLASRGMEVIATTRNPEHFPPLNVQVARFEAAKRPDLSFVPYGARVLYSIPVLEPEDITSDVIAHLPVHLARVVYLSTTGVYGDTENVDALTEPSPRDPQGHARVTAEAAVLNGPWPAMVLRPAAIYGPGRGIHVSMREGRFRMAGQGQNYVSRIHVDDLAAHCVAALFSGVTGSWPVADDHPCTTREIAEFCSSLLNLPMPPSADPATVHRTRRANRQVDGSAVRHALGIRLAYPSYREGIPASLTS